MPFEIPVIGASVGIEQQFIGIETMPCFRRVRAMNTVAVDGAGSNVGEITMPDLVRVLRQRDAVDFLFVRVEDTNLNLCGVSGKKSKIGALAVPSCATRMRQTLSDPVLIDGGHSSLSDALATQAI